MPDDLQASRRRLVRWVIGSGVVISTLAVIGTVLWMKLPSWAPDLVIRHSPFIRPVMRAMEAQYQAGASVWDRDEAFAARAKAWGTATIPHVMAMLDSSVSSYRSAALQTWGVLAQNPDIRPPPDLIEALCTHGRDDLAEANRALAIYGLSKVIDPQVGPVLIAGLRDSHSEVREAAMWVIRDKAQRTPEILAALAGVLSDPEVEVRKRSAALIGESQDIRATEALITALSRERDMEVSVEQVWALGRLADRRAIAPLLQVIGQPVVTTQQVDLFAEALKSLEMIDQAQAIPLLIQALTHAHPGVRFAAVERLRVLREPSATPHLLERLGDSDALVRALTAMALAELNDAPVIDPLLDGFSKGCCERHDSDATHLGKGGYDVSRSSLLKAIDRLPFTDAQRKRWEGMRVE